MTKSRERKYPFATAGRWHDRQWSLLINDSNETVRIVSKRKKGQEHHANGRPNGIWNRIKPITAKRSVYTTHRLVVADYGWRCTTV